MGPLMAHTATWCVDALALFSFGIQVGPPAVQVVHTKSECVGFLAENGSDSAVEHIAT